MAALKLLQPTPLCLERGKLISGPPDLGGFLGEASSAQPFWGLGTRVMTLTGVSPVDASLSHPFQRGPYEGSERDSPRSGGGNWGGQGSFGSCIFYEPIINFN